MQGGPGPPVGAATGHTKRARAYVGSRPGAQQRGGDTINQTTKRHHRTAHNRPASGPQSPPGRRPSCRPPAPPRWRRSRGPAPRRRPARACRWGPGSCCLRGGRWGMVSVADSPPCQLQPAALQSNQQQHKQSSTHPARAAPRKCLPARAGSGGWACSQWAARSAAAPADGGSGAGGLVCADVAWARRRGSSRAAPCPWPRRRLCSCLRYQRPPRISSPAHLGIGHGATADASPGGGQGRGPSGAHAARDQRGGGGAQQGIAQHALHLLQLRGAGDACGGAMGAGGATQGRRPAAGSARRRRAAGGGTGGSHQWRRLIGLVGAHNLGRPAPPRAHGPGGGRREGAGGAALHSVCGSRVGLQAVLARQRRVRWRVRAMWAGGDGLL